MMKSNFHKGALVLMALLLCLAAAPSGLAEEEGLSLRLDAEILLTGTVPAAAETYTVRMTADNGRNPMPGGQVEDRLATEILAGRLAAAMTCTSPARALSRFRP